MTFELTRSIVFVPNARLSALVAMLSCEIGRLRVTFPPFAGTQSSTSLEPAKT